MKGRDVRTRAAPFSPKAVDIRFGAEAELQERLNETPTGRVRRDLQGTFSPGGRQVGAWPRARSAETPTSRMAPTAEENIEVGARPRALSGNAYQNHGSPRIPRGLLPALPGEPAMESPTSGRDMHFNFGDVMAADIGPGSDFLQLKMPLRPFAPLDGGRMNFDSAARRVASGRLRGGGETNSPSSPLMVRKVASAPDSQKMLLQQHLATMRLRMPFANASPRYQDRHGFPPQYPEAHAPPAQNGAGHTSTRRVPSTGKAARRQPDQSPQRERSKERNVNKMNLARAATMPEGPSHLLTKTPSPVKSRTVSGAIPVPMLATALDRTFSSPSTHTNQGMYMFRDEMGPTPSPSVLSESTPQPSPQKSAARPLPTLGTCDALNHQVEALHQSVLEADLEQVERLLSEVAQGTVDLPHSISGHTVLWEAVARGHEDIASRLLASGANPNMGHPVSGPPLLHAAAWGESAILQLLIGHGAEVNATDAKRFTALHYACFCGQVEAAALLLQAGASLTAQTITGETPKELCSSAEVRELFTADNVFARQQQRPESPVGNGMGSPPSRSPANKGGALPDGLLPHPTSAHKQRLAKPMWPDSRNGEPATRDATSEPTSHEVDPAADLPLAQRRQLEPRTGTPEALTPMRRRTPKTPKHVGFHSELYTVPHPPPPQQPSPAPPLAPTPPLHPPPVPAAAANGVTAASTLEKAAVAQSTEQETVWSESPEQSQQRAPQVPPPSEGGSERSKGSGSRLSVLIASPTGDTREEMEMKESYIKEEIDGSSTPEEVKGLIMNPRQSLQGWNSPDGDDPNAELTNSHKERAARSSEATTKGMDGEEVSEVMEDLFRSSIVTTTGDILWQKGELLGEGAYGKVYAGLNQKTGELMAVKQHKLPDLEKEAEPHLVKQAEEEMATLEHEIEVLKKLRHKHIVGYVAAQRISPTEMYVFLEYVPGGSISSMLKRFGCFGHDLVRLYARQLLLGLEYLHNRKIIHRDLKGANVLVTRNGVLKIADFGASKVFKAEGTVTDGLKSMKGSLFWMAPEVLKGVSYGRRADIWSVGCVVLEMFTGKHPWPNMENGWAAIFQIAKTNSGPPVPDDLPDIAKDFLGQTFQFDPKDRPTCTQLLQHPFVCI